MDKNPCVRSQLTGFGVGDDEANFEVGVADSFHGLPEREESHQSDAEHRRKRTENPAICVRFRMALSEPHNKFRSIRLALLQAHRSC